jgi:uncharacterized protein (TIGR00106 family)
MPRIIAEIATDPIGGNTPSESDYVVAAERILQNARRRGDDIHYRINALSTTVEGDFHTVVHLLEQMHEAPFQEGARRVLTTIRIDDRRDREPDMDRSVQVVEKKLDIGKAEMC